MRKSFLKIQLLKFLKQILNNINRKHHIDDLKRPAIVFSPHFDDETLGCGGTILKKKRAGADINIVFMTDGSKSHTHLISEQESKTIRSKEGLAASKVLGLKHDDVFFLDHEETKLSEHQEHAIDQVTEILEKQQSEEVFIPYHKEPLLWSGDHVATSKIVMSALKMYHRKMIIYGYPIWFWCHWPWVSMRLRRRREIFQFIKYHSVIPNFNLFLDFNCAVYIEDVLNLKHTALNQHKSQMTRLIPTPRWRTLADVSNGEFLKCFFQEYEIFHKRLL